ncbi:hypothetical protein WG66_000120 [Moniliophthora roreri]|uniref:Arrestin-like N-terminal domain-containing protein n=1 Tax=Moniliophthora roreri TaxID=221103 RepID=A0A0W0EY57_MONRR|nr:hypothetical protein WG66_000120 [Moniliophthora roreri]
MALALPEYTPSLPSPHYSADPMCGETTLASTSRSISIHRTPTGTFTKDFGSMAVTLEQQEETATCPSYGRNGLIAGNIMFREAGPILQVQLKLAGKLRLNISGCNGGSKSVKTINETFDLWSTSSSTPTCPETLPFATVLPSTFQDGDTSRPLPPSYEVTYTGVPGLFAKCSYYLQILIKSRSPIWTRKKFFHLPLHYIPRKRPHQPVLNGRDFISTVKVLPEEWHQSSSVLKVRYAHKNILKPVDIYFFVPIVRVFGLSDTIPIHIQFSGPLSSLQKVYSHLILEDESLPKWEQAKRAQTSMVFSVTLRRQISIEVKGRQAYKNWVIGDGVLRPTAPPFMEPDQGLRSPGDIEEMDWEGEMRCKEDVRVGQFNAGSIAVRDYILFSISSPSTAIPFHAVANAVAISLTTDPWSAVV